MLGELDSTISVFGTSTEGIFGGTGQRIGTLPTGFAGRNDAAEIAIHPQGKFLYASNRGRDSIAIFGIDSDGGNLTPVAEILTGGKEPRHFAIDSAGRFLLAENQLSDNIVEFRIDATTGKLTLSGEIITVPSPVCLVSVPLK